MVAEYRFALVLHMHVEHMLHMHVLHMHVEYIYASKRAKSLYKCDPCSKMEKSHCG